MENQTTAQITKLKFVPIHQTKDGIVTGQLFTDGAIESFICNIDEHSAKQIIESLNTRDKLAEALKEMIESCNPRDVTSHKMAQGLDLGEFYVGACGIPSDKAVHMAVNALKKYEQK